MNNGGKITRDVALRAGLLGFVAGLRSQLPLAMLAVAAHRGKFATDSGRPFDLLRKRPVAIGLGLAAAGELIGDKLPVTPSRLAPAPLGGRLVFGSAAGAAVADDAGGSIGIGAGIGAAGALAGSYAGYHARSYLDRTTGWPDTVWAIAEDVIALSLGLYGTRKTTEGEA